MVVPGFIVTLRCTNYVHFNIQDSYGLLDIFLLKFTVPKSCNYYKKKLRYSSLGHRWPQPIMSIMFRPFGCIAHTHFSITWLSNISILSVTDEGYSRNVSYALILISTFLFHCRSYFHSYIKVKNVHFNI